MITRVFRQVGTAAAAFAVVLPAAMSLTSSAVAAPRDTDDRPSMEHVVKHQSPRNKQIQPYKNERSQRYTSESTKMTSVPPCSILPPDPADWPSSVSSCEGPAPKPTKQATRPPQNTAPNAGSASPGNSGGGGGRPASGASGSTGRSAPSCR